MSNELEKRLRELWADHQGSPAGSTLDLLYAAARIGAELEREECEREMQRLGGQAALLRQPKRHEAFVEATAAIRARGGK